MKNIYEVLIPVANNNGEVFPEKYQKAFRDYVGILVGGLTRYPEVEGTWYDDGGKIYREKMIPIRVLCSEEDINRIAEQAKLGFEQKAIMVMNLGTAKIYI